MLQGKEQGLPRIPKGPSVLQGMTGGGGVQRSCCSMKLHWDLGALGPQEAQ